VRSHESSRRDVGVRTLLPAVAVLVVACGGGDADAARPLVGQIDPAMAAVDAELGSPQRYFEVNATPQVVNLFVASAHGTTVTPYVYVGGELAPAGRPASASGSTFAADSVAFEPTILDAVAEELPEADLSVFTIVGGPDGAVQYSVDVQSERGGTLTVVLGPDGAVQSVGPAG
jgi:hypothetical protein